MDHRILGYVMAVAFVVAGPAARAYEYNDSHLQLTNYVHRGPSAKRFLKLMGDKAGRVALFGSDSVAPATQQDYVKTWRDYAPLWPRLDAATRHPAALGNYERLFDAAGRRVRDWELKRFKSMDDALPPRHQYYGSMRGEIESRLGGSGNR